LSIIRHERYSYRINIWAIQKGFNVETQSRILLFQILLAMQPKLSGNHGENHFSIVFFFPKPFLKISVAKAIRNEDLSHKSRIISPGVEGFS